MQDRETASMKDTSRKGLVCLPYIKGLSERLSMIFRAHGIESNMFHQILCPLKDPVKKETSGVIYQIN